MKNEIKKSISLLLAIILSLASVEVLSYAKAEPRVAVPMTMDSDQQCL